MLDARLEQHLVADADAEHRPTPGQPSADDLGTADRRSVPPCSRKRADAGHDEPVAVQRRRRSPPVTVDVGAGSHQSTLGRAKVARPVVEQDDPSGRRCHRLPLVLGTPVSRGSRATASRSARASALNCASTMWCGSRPDSTRMWRQIAAWARDRLEHVPGQRADVGAADHDVLLAVGLAGVDAVRPPGHVDRALHQRLVERHERVTEPPDPGLVAQCLAQRLAEHDRDVLDGVVGVDVDVAVGLDVRSNRPCRASAVSMWS